MARRIQSRAISGTVLREQPIRQVFSRVIDKLRDLSAIRFADKPAGTQAIALAVTSGDNHKLEKVTINKAADEYYGIREGDPTVYVIDGKAGDDLQKAISGIRKK